MGAPTNVRVDLRTAADELGVHYQTAYRWVRTGRLDAALVGGRYLVSATDIAELDRARHAPTARSTPRPTRLDRAAERMYVALVAGDEPLAVRIVGRLAEEGAPTIELIRTVLAPPLRAIGQAWADGEVTVWVEHRASAIVERLLGDLAPNPRGRRRGVVTVAALAGDRHSLPTTMAAVALRADNWHVHHLGADLPPDELIGFCEAHDVNVAVITVTNPETRTAAELAATRLRGVGTPAIVGGLGNDLTELIDHTRRAAGHPVPSREPA
jgi:MerR family transcriptional regulator, light-induced transcriptional regulator